MTLMDIERLTPEQVKKWDKEIYGEEEREVFKNCSLNVTSFHNLSSSQQWEELGVREL